MALPQRKYKYNNKKVEYDGHNFHSQLERSVYQWLQLREKNKEIKIIKTQQHIHLYSQGIKLGEYWPDFTCIDLKSKEIFWVEGKGKSDNADWRYKLNIWRAGGPGLLEVWGGKWQSPFLMETVIPVVPKFHIIESQVYGKLEI